ncbi:MAG TPA: GAF and ANTAR domain-containing protein [Acidimicrobiia bacterium]|nr:GAF and ANTAR domain-containing protein [Acidimicrobiia bacterium]
MDEPTDALEDELSELAGLLLANETLETMLGHVAHIAVRAIPSCDAAGVTLFERDQLTTAAASGPLVRRVDEHQYGTDEGPCLESLRTGELRRSASLEADTRWPKFRAPAIREGVVSCLSLPLVIGNHGPAGVLNLYSQNRPFGKTDEEIGRRFVAPASVAVANARAYAKARAVIEQLEEALKSRDVIGQAKGIIEAREHCGSDEAFERLRDLSQHRNVKLRDLAAAIVESPDTYLSG